MADKTYATAVGFVQFKVEERDVNGQTVRDVTIRTPGTDGKLIRITLWPEYAAQEVALGDFIAVDGDVTTREHEGKTYVNMNASKLVVFEGATRLEREVVSRKPASKSKF